VETHADNCVRGSSASAPTDLADAVDLTCRTTATSRAVHTLVAQELNGSSEWSQHLQMPVP